MKHPKDSTDPIDRHNAAGAQTVIIGGDTANNSAPTSLIEQEPVRPKLEAGSARNPAPAAAPTRAIPSDSGHTRIIGYQGAPSADGGRSADPVVGWLVVLDGPGKGNHRAIYNGSNTIGRSSSQRIAIDFGDDTISGEQQAFLVYDGRKRQFSLVPNLGRPNLVQLNESALLANAELKARDRITMGRTTLLFMPLCGPDFDWSDTTSAMMSK